MASQDILISAAVDVSEVKGLDAAIKSINQAMANTVRNNIKNVIAAATKEVMAMPADEEGILSYQAADAAIKQIKKAKTTSAQRAAVITSSATSRVAREDARRRLVEAVTLEDRIAAYGDLYVANERVRATDAATRQVTTVEDARKAFEKRIENSKGWLEKFTTSKSAGERAFFLSQAKKSLTEAGTFAKATGEFVPGSTVSDALLEAQTGLVGAEAGVTKKGARTLLAQAYKWKEQAKDARTKEERKFYEDKALSTYRQAVREADKAGALTPGSKDTKMFAKASKDFSGAVNSFIDVFGRRLSIAGAVGFGAKMGGMLGAAYNDYVLAGYSERDTPYLSKQKQLASTYRSVGKTLGYAAGGALGLAAGMAIGGPVGAVVGGLIGAAGGWLGEVLGAGKEKKLTSEQTTYQDVVDFNRYRASFGDMANQRYAKAVELSGYATQGDIGALNMKGMTLKSRMMFGMVSAQEMLALSLNPALYAAMMGGATDDELVKAAQAGMTGDKGLDATVFALAGLPDNIRALISSGGADRVRQQAYIYEDQARILRTAGPAYEESYAADIQAKNLADRQNTWGAAGATRNIDGMGLSPWQQKMLAIQQNIQNMPDMIHGKPAVSGDIIIQIDGVETQRVGPVLRSADLEPYIITTAGSML